jgi:hypothetical protein
MNKQNCGKEPTGSKEIRIEKNCWRKPCARINKYRDTTGTQNI